MRSKFAVFPTAFLLVAILAAIFDSQRVVCASGNVTWTFVDSISGCPAGDSVVAGHPSKLRILVTYLDANGQPKFVPPESVWVTYSVPGGLIPLVSNVQVNDQIPSKIYADDSTRAGVARIFFPSVSGCGKLNVTLFVSGVSKGTKQPTFSTMDSLDVGRITGADTLHLCDLNYDGAVNATDKALARVHAQHWHRQALHGGMVRRTNYCETCNVASENSLGLSAISWSPNGRYAAYTAFQRFAPPICRYIGDSLACDSISCKVFIVPSDPSVNPQDPNRIRQITSVPMRKHDYDPMWSPDGTFLMFDRGDSVIIRKGVLGWNADTTDVPITSSSCVSETGETEGDENPAISPDQQWVAFSRCNPFPPGGHSIWKVLINGGTPQRLTNDSSSTEFWPAWSPDGQRIYFQRQLAGPSYRLSMVASNANSAACTDVFVPPFNSTAVLPSFAMASTPESTLAVCAYGQLNAFTRTVATTLFDPSAASWPLDPQYVVRNYVDTTYMARGDFPTMSPRISPDGTRLVLGSKQIWTSRRNMNRPPVITSFGSSSINDTTVYIGTLDVPFGGTTNYTIGYTDPEGDAGTCRTVSMQSWITMANCVLSVAPGWADIGHVVTAEVVLATPSGGSDVLLARFHVIVGNAVGPMSQTDDVSALVPRIEVLGPNPTRAAFAVSTSGRNKSRATLTIFDVAGRVVARVRGRVGDALRWDGGTPGGPPAGNGIYFYRAQIPGLEKRGRIVIVR